MPLWKLKWPVYLPVLKERVDYLLPLWININIYKKKYIAEMSIFGQLFLLFVFMTMGALNPIDALHHFLINVMCFISPSQLSKLQ